MNLIRDARSREAGRYDLETRCFNCRAFAYCCCYRGEWTVSGFLCAGCIALMDGEYK